MSTKFILTALFIVFVSSLSVAAPPPPSGGPGCWPPPCVPIDGGISILIAAGALYGAKTLYNKHKENKQTL